MDIRHVLDVTDLEPSELRRVMDLAEVPIEAIRKVLTGQGAALIFEKPSNRTRHATEMAVVQLGGHPVYTRGEEIGFDTRETVEDVTMILAGYHALIAARVFSHSTLVRMAEASDVPVVNLLSDRSHPMQAFADVLTMRQCFGELAGRTVSWVGDWNNVARSLSEASSMLGMHVRLGCPPGHQAPDEELARIAALGAASLSQHDRPEAAVAGADAVHTDVWTSMGQEAERQARLAAFEGFQVTEALMAEAGADALFFHCLPAHRGEEVSSEVIDGARSRVFPQGHNRMHAARGLLAFVFGVFP